ncbi:hypothetical protein ACJX0J_024144 [Zea mays]
MDVSSPIHYRSPTSSRFLTISFVSLHWARVGGYWWLGRGALIFFSVSVQVDHISGTPWWFTGVFYGEGGRILAFKTLAEKQEVVWDFYNNLLGTAVLIHSFAKIVTKGLRQGDPLSPILNGHGQILTFSLCLLYCGRWPEYFSAYDRFFAGSQEETAQHILIHEEKMQNKYRLHI